MVGVFKRQARVLSVTKNRSEGDMEGFLDELADIYVLIVSEVGFLEVSDMLFHSPFSRFGRNCFLSQLPLKFKTSGCADCLPP